MKKAQGACEHMSVRPKLNGDTFFMPVSDGVYFRNNRDTLRLKGKHIYAWVENLVPYLNGQYSLDDLIKGLDAEKQKMVAELVNILLTNHFLKDAGADLPHQLDAQELQAYAAEIAFIDSFQDSGAYRFERFREKRVLLTGAGLTLTALVHAALKAGLRQVSVLYTDECERQEQRHYEYVQHFRERDARQELHEIASLPWDDEAQVISILQDFDAVVHISDRAMLARTKMLNRLCFLLGKTCIQAVLVDDYAWIGPLVHSRKVGCWECAWRRLQTNITNAEADRSHYTFQDHPATPVSRFNAPPTAAMTANHLIFELFKHITEAGPLETLDALIDFDLETLHQSHHPFLPHPLCETCAQPIRPTREQFQAAYDRLEQQESLEVDLFSKQATSLFEKKLGLLRSIDEEVLLQTPLKACRVVLSPPLRANVERPLAVIGTHVSFREARRKATQEACAIYATQLYDTRRFLSSAEIPDRQLICSGEQFLSEYPRAGSEMWTWAKHLGNWQAYLVPAELVYPALKSGPATDTSSVGVGSGMSWAEALCKALFSWNLHLTMENYRQRQQPYPQVKLKEMTLDPEGTRQRYLLAYARQTVTVYDITGPLRIPTFAFLDAKGKTVAYSTHTDVGQALRDGLEQALFHVQLQLLHQTDQMPVPMQILLEHLNLQLPVQQQTDFAFSPLIELPHNLRGTTSVIPAYDFPQEWFALTSHLLQQFQQEGWQACAVPLDADPAVTQMLPFIMRVLLMRTERRSE